MKKLNTVRGASMVEYALLLFAVLIVAAAAIKTLGTKVQQAGTDGAAQLASCSSALPGLKFFRVSRRRTRQ